MLVEPRGDTICLAPQVLEVVCGFLDGSSRIRRRFLNAVLTPPPLRNLSSPPQLPWCGRSPSPIEEERWLASQIADGQAHPPSEPDAQMGVVEILDYFVMTEQN